MTDATSTSPELPDDTDSPSHPGPIVASIQARIHLRRSVEADPEGTEPIPTLPTLEAAIEGAVYVAAPGFTASVSAERIDR